MRVIHTRAGDLVAHKFKIIVMGNFFPLFNFIFLQFRKLFFDIFEGFYDIILPDPRDVS